MRLSFLIVSMLLLGSCSSPYANKMECEQPSGWRQKSNKIPAHAVVIRVKVSNNKIYFNKNHLDYNELKSSFKTANSLYPKPFFILSVQDTSCKFVNNVVSFMNVELGCNNGLCGYGDGWTN